MANINQKQRMALDRMLDQQASLDEKIEELKQKLGAAQDARVQLQSRIAEAKEACVKEGI